MQMFVATLEIPSFSCQPAIACCCLFNVLAGSIWPSSEESLRTARKTRKAAWKPRSFDVCFEMTLQIDSFLMGSGLTEDSLAKRVVVDHLIEIIYVLVGAGRG